MNDARSTLRFRLGWGCRTAVLLENAAPKNVDPGLIKPSHHWGGDPSKSGLNPH